MIKKEAENANKEATSVFAFASTEQFSNYNFIEFGVDASSPHEIVAGFNGCNSEIILNISAVDCTP